MVVRLLFFHVLLRKAYGLYIDLWLHMDDLTRAAAQFHPALRGMNVESSLGGMNGGFNPPPDEVLLANEEASTSDKRRDRGKELLDEEKWKELLRSKEWKECEQHILKVETRKNF